MANRQRRGNLWIPDPANRICGPLSRRTAKGRLSASQARRLKFLVEKIDRPLAERMAGELFGGTYNVKVADAWY